MLSVFHFSKVRYTYTAIKMEGGNPPRRPTTLWTFHSQEELSQYAVGCDADIGGTSTCNLTMGEEGKGRFWGDMKLAVKPGLEQKVRGGYAGFRNKTRNTLFGELMDDVSLHEYLLLRVKIGGDPRTHNSYFANIQTESSISTDLFQHRLWFSKPNEWEDIIIPFDAFVLTNSGELVSREMTMMTHRVRTIGISILGGNSGVEGKYEIGLDVIKAVNEDDLDVIPRQKLQDQGKWGRNAF
ncbi:complex I intermediate-associated protein 30-domain-containing protein [Gautieria morchelliformis]|nr:complex I intermediate-associated protein 30-domain-containing protein [Gautieria morchelliformis]